MHSVAENGRVTIAEGAVNTFLRVRISLTSATGAEKNGKREMNELLVTMVYHTRHASLCPSPRCNRVRNLRCRSARWQRGVSGVRFYYGGHFAPFYLVGGRIRKRSKDADDDDAEGHKCILILIFFSLSSAIVCLTYF